MEGPESIKLTQYSHGAGCGCKISPAVLSEILGTDERLSTFPNLLVGNQEKDDAAVYDLDGSTSIVSTTDFFMPIVDDPKDFGAIAATNAISDIYAMGGTPLMAIAILGWPIKSVALEHAHAVIEGGREACARAGIPLAGGHSIDAPEPIFGLAVTGTVPTQHIKRNSTAQSGDLLYLTKPLGIGMVATAQKRGIALPEELDIAVRSMTELNSIGQELAAVADVHAITDVTGFGLGGHLLEMCSGSGLGAELNRADIPSFPFAQRLLDAQCFPGGTERNWASYGDEIRMSEATDKYLLADPQTSGGLLLAVNPSAQTQIERLLVKAGLDANPMGRMTSEKNGIEVLP